MTSGVENQILNLTSGVENLEIHYLSLSSPSNVDRVDVDSYEVTLVNSNVTVILSNNTVEYTIPSLYTIPLLYRGESRMDLEIVAVDRCKRKSVPSRVSGMYYSSIKASYIVLEN